MEHKFFLTQVKHTNGTYEKGVVVKDTYDAAQQSFHAYLGAYAFGNNAQTDYVLVQIIDDQAAVLDWKVWDARQEENPEEQE